MGWKVSMVIIENPENIIDDTSILKAIRKGNYTFEDRVSLENCIHPRDNSISIGKYNGNIIICDDFQLTTNSLESAEGLDLTTEEENLCKLFPNSEIVQVACHSTVNYHGYSLIKNGEKVRLKIITSETPIIEFGERVYEEEILYSKSYQKDGVNYWSDEFDPNEEYLEDQLMEDFTFGIAKRRLGVTLDRGDGEELMEKVTFNKYKKEDISFFQRILNIFSSF